MDNRHHETVHSVAQYALFILQDEFGDAVHIVTPTRFELPVGSTRVTTEIAAAGDHAVVLVAAPVALDVPASPELYEHVARQGGSPSLGAMVVMEAGSMGLVNVLLFHHIYGNCLDRAELLTSVANVAGQADDADEAFVERFGGRRFSDAKTPHAH